MCALSFLRTLSITPLHYSFGCIVTSLLSLDIFLDFQPEFTDTYSKKEDMSTWSCMSANRNPLPWHSVILSKLWAVSGVAIRLSVSTEKWNRNIVHAALQDTDIKHLYISPAAALCCFGSLGRAAGFHASSWIWIFCLDKLFKQFKFDSLTQQAHI